MDITAVINNLFHYASIILAVIAGLVFLTNVFAEVIKNAFPRVPANYLVILIAIGLTVTAMLVAVEILEITLMWYYAAGAVVLGFAVAYAAMIGFDKFLGEVFARIREVTENLEAFR